MKYIGIDVSKATFVVAYSSDKGGEIRTFDNTTAGIRQFIGTLPKEDDSIHCVMEATGNYSALLLYMLNVAGITVSMENPLKVKNFAKALLSTVKTDKSDNIVTQNYVTEHVEIGIASLRMIIDEKKTVKHLKFDW